MSEATDGQFDITAFDSVIQHAKDLQQRYSARNNLFTRMENIYWMRWDEETKVKKQIENVKLTKSPRGKNAIKGAISMLIASDPIIQVPRDINNKLMSNMSDKVEKVAKAEWFASGRISGDPIHYDVVRSGLLYDEIHIAINDTDDIVKHAQGAAPAVVKRAQDIAERTSHLFEVWNPKAGFAERSKLGLDAFYRKVTTTAGYIEDNYGSRGKEALNRMEARMQNRKYGRYDTVTLNYFIDLKDTTIWLSESDRPILQEEHGLPFLPIVAQTVSGSSLFDAPEDKVEPFLRILDESGIWKRQNMILTVLYTMLFAIGANPMFVAKVNDPDSPLAIDFSKAGGLVKLRINEDFQSLIKQVIDPSVMQAWNIANDLEMESTIYRQTLGEPMGSNAPYSMVALLAQAGRLPLTTTQRKASWGIGEAIEKALKWRKFENKGAKGKYEKINMSVLAKDIPDQFEINAVLDIALPQDRLSAANTAAVLGGGDNPMVSKSWIRENILNIGQPDDMTREVWEEKVAELFYRKFVLGNMAQIAQLEQMALQPGAASGIPGSEQNAPTQAGGPIPQGSQELQNPNNIGPQPAEPVPPIPPIRTYQGPRGGV